MILQSSPGADDEVTLRENHAVFGRIWLKPRVMRDVSKIDLSSTILGYPTSLPLYITATALGKLAHPDGEVLAARSTMLLPWLTCGIAAGGAHSGGAIPRNHPDGSNTWVMFSRGNVFRRQTRPDAVIPAVCQQRSIGHEEAD